MKILSTTEAAAELGISAARVRVLIASGRLKATRVGERSFAIESRHLDAVRERKMGRPRKRRS